MRVALKAAVNAGSRLSCRSFKLKSAIVFSSGQAARPGLVIGSVQQESYVIPCCLLWE
jgi:hypothetical protein